MVDLIFYLKQPKNWSFLPKDETEFILNPSLNQCEVSDFYSRALKEDFLFSLRSPHDQGTLVTHLWLIILFILSLLNKMEEVLLLVHRGGLPVYKNQLHKNDPLLVSFRVAYIRYSHKKNKSIIFLSY